MDYKLTEYDCNINKTNISILTATYVARAESLLCRLHESRSIRIIEDNSYKDTQNLFLRTFEHKFLLISENKIK